MVRLICLVIILRKRVNEVSNRSVPPAVAGGSSPRHHPPATAGGSDLSMRNAALNSVRCYASKKLGQNFLTCHFTFALCARQTEVRRTANPKTAKNQSENTLASADRLSP